MKIGVISDTHGNLAALEKALEHLSDADMIVHAGDVLYHPPKLGWSPQYDVPAFAARLNHLDIPVVIAQGNCDAQVYEELLHMPVQSPYAFAQMGSIRIVANHGHLLRRPQMVEVATRHKAQYFISGHTHVPVLERVDHVTLLNPGSPAIPKYEHHGKLIPTIGIITESGARIINIDDGTTVFELLSG